MRKIIASEFMTIDGVILFQDGTIPASFNVTQAQVAPKGIIIVSYERDGDVKTGAPQIKEDT
jgi:hypothetical protein